MLLTDSKGKNLYVSDEPFARGGEGDIHQVTGSHHKGCCVKIFHKDKIQTRKAKLEYMVNHPLTAPDNTSYRICWPVDLVYKSGACVGFVMQLSFMDSHSLYDIYLKDGSDKFQRSTQRGMVNRYILLYNIANVLNILHALGYVMVDFKPQNILFTDKGGISMIDMDSVQIGNKDKLLFESSAATAEYSYPKELHLLGNSKLSPEWDEYGFAVVAYQLLLGIHPFTASTNAVDDNGNSISTTDQLMQNNLFPFGPRKKDIIAKPPLHFYFYELPSDLKKLFIHTFDLNHSSPSMNDWKECLKKIITKKKAVPNLFRANPKQPIFILTSKLPKTLDKSREVKMEWASFFCEKLSINEKDVTNRKSMSFIVPKDGIIRIKASNKNGTIQKTIEIQGLSSYCIYCGNKFEKADDLYCIYCGRERN